MKSKSVKILSFILTALIVIAMATSVFADNWIIDDISATKSDASDSFENAASMILGVVQVVAIAVAIIMLIVLAIKYISSAPNEKAEIKKHAVIYIVGAVILFGASGILQLIKTFSSEAFNADK